MAPNVPLRMAREASTSPHVPGEPMSRAELADAVNAELWRSTNKAYGLDAHTIARYERGAVRWPNAAYRSALRAVLGVQSDAALGFFPTPRGGRPAGGRHGPVDDDLQDFEVTRSRPRQIGRTEVDRIRLTTAALARSENLFGGGLTCEAAAAQLRATAQLLALPAHRRIRADLAEAIGNMAAVVAFAALDVNDLDAVDRCFRFSLRCADESGSWSLRSNTLADMSRIEALAGRLDDALSLVELAQVRADRLTLTARAMTSMLRGRILAHLGRVAEAQDELERADEWMTLRDPSDDPPWLCYYDTAEHLGSTGRALTVLAGHTGDPSAARRRLTGAVAQAGDLYPRSRTFSRVRLAALLMRAGEVTEATTIGTEALQESREFHSHRIRVELGALARACREHPRHHAAAELRREITASPGRG